MNFEPTLSSDQPDDHDSHFSDPFQTPTSDPDFIHPASDRPQPLSLGGLLAWITIATVTVTVFYLLASSKLSEISNPNAELSTAELAQVEWQGKLFVGQNQLAPQANPTPPPVTLDVGPFNQRICYTILVNEIQGPVAAQAHLKTTAERVKSAGLELTDEQKKLQSSIGTLMDGYASGDFSTDSLTDGDLSLLAEDLGWYGELVLVPAGTANVETRNEVLAQTKGLMMSTMILLGVGCLVAILGLIVAIVLMVVLFTGKIRSRFTHQLARHNIYAETFAIWMIVFFGGQIPFGMILAGLGQDQDIEALKWMPLLFFGSLLTLAWPVIRGIPWSEVLTDIGWRIGNPIVELGVALMAYLALLPAILVSMIAVVVLLVIFNPAKSVDDFSSAGGPSHPIQEFLAEGNLSVLAMVLVLACVAAPIVEETMFRGVFYRHLRDWTAGWHKIFGVGVACLVNSFVFAAIHPQGIFGIPMLMTLAIGFSLARQWRGSLLAPMLMHAINNFLVTLLAFAIM